MSLDCETGVLTILPHMEFNFPLEIEYLQEGHSFEEGDESKIDFVYLNPNGVYESLPNRNIHIKIETGEVKVQQALTDHTSRFGTVWK